MNDICLVQEELLFGSGQRSELNPGIIRDRVTRISNNKILWVFYETSPCSAVSSVVNKTGETIHHAFTAEHGEIIQLSKLSHYQISKIPVLSAYFAVS
ncbi:MAG: hypothetical protein ACRD8U_11310 [Pyrinomonadaceae bacterium]